MHFGNNSLSTAAHTKPRRTFLNHTISTCVICITICGGVGNVEKRMSTRRRHWHF